MSSYRTALRRIVSIATAVSLTAGIAGAQAAAKMDKKEMKEGKQKMEEKGGMKWGPGPDFLPKGAKLHVASGDPAAAGPFVIHLMFPNRYSVKPHSHPADENVKVVSGKLLYGMGDTMDRKSMKSLTKGQEITLAAKQNHYALARGRTVLEIRGTGPFATTYVNAKDDPRGMKK